MVQLTRGIVRPASRSWLVPIVAVLSVACSDSTAPPSTALTGTYALESVGSEALPVVLGTGIDGTHTDLTGATLTIVSADTIRAIATADRVNAQGTVVAQLADTVRVSYAVVTAGGEQLLVLSRRFGSFVRADTGTIVAGSITMRSGRIATPQAPPFVVADGFYVRRAN